MRHTLLYFLLECLGSVHFSDNSQTARRATEEVEEEGKNRMEQQPASQPSRCFALQYCTHYNSRAKQYD